MKKIICIILAFIVCVSLADAQNYPYYMGGKATQDTLVSNTEDTTGTFNLWYSTSSRRPGDYCFEVYLKAIDSNTTHDSLETELWVTSAENAAKSSYLWMYVCTYNSWLSGDYGGDVVLVADESIIIVADTLEYISSRYARLILKFIGGTAADSTKYLVKLMGDRGASQ